MSTGTKRQSVKSKTSKSTTKKAKKGKSDSGSKRQDNWRSEARALGKEKKYLDIYLSPLVAAASEALAHSPNYSIPWNPSTTGSVLCANLVPQGDTIVTRKDNAIKLRSLYIQGQFRVPSNLNDATRELITNSYPSPLPALAERYIGPGVLRVSVIYDESPNGASWSAADLCKQIFGLDAAPGKPQFLLTGSNIQDSGNAASNQYTSDAFQNMRGQGRFRLLADERMPFGGAKIAAGEGVPNPVNVYPGATGAIIMTYSRYLKLGGIATHFSKSTESIDVTSIMKGALYVISQWVEGIPTVEPPVFEGCIRLRFDD